MSRRLYLGSERFMPAHLELLLRAYSAGLPADVRSEDVSKLFEGYGRIVDCRVMTGEFLLVFGRILLLYLLSAITQVSALSNLKTTRFVGATFMTCTTRNANLQDAEDALHNFNGKPFMGSK